MTVSVAVAVYNGSRHIRKCIECLCDQTYRDFEVLFVVDSKTNDDSLEILESEMGRLPAARVIIQEDKDRLAGARNIGIREAKGDIIWFLDVDDHPMPMFLEDLVRIMGETGADMVFCNHFQVTDGSIPEIPKAEYSIRTYDDYSALKSFTELPVYSWSRIQRTSLLADGRAMFYNHPSAEDIEQTVKSLALARKVVYYNKPLYVYFKVGQSLTSQNRSKDAASIESTARRTMDFIREVRPECMPEFERGMLERLMRQMAFVSYREYCRTYEDSIAHKMLGDIPDKSMEMKVFKTSRALYFLALYPFTRWIWDGRSGPWDRNI